MLAETTQTWTRVIHAGRFPVESLVAAGVVLAVVLGVMVWYEARRSRRRLFVPLLALRLGAVAVVLWMLAERTMQTEVQRTRTKALCLMVDDSASMTVADEPADDGIDGEAVRWAAADLPSEIAGPLTGLDGASAALASVARQGERLTELSRREERGEADRLAGRLQELGRSVVASLDAARESVSAAAVERGDIGAIGEQVAAEVIEPAAGIQRDLRRPAGLADEALAGRVAELARTAAELSARTRRLADRLAEAYARQADPAVGERVRAAARMPRIERVGRWMDHAGQGWLLPVERQARVLRYKFHTEVFGVSGPAAFDPAARVRAADEPAAQGTDLAGALRQVARESAVEPLEAVLLLTDGRHTAEGDPLQAASAGGGPPVFVVPVGNLRPLRDVVLHHAQAPRAVFQNDRIVFEALVDADGYAGEELNVDLLRGEAVLETRTIKVPSDAYVARVSFTCKADSPGEQPYRIRARLLPGEKIRDNNQADLIVQVAEDKIRALLVDRLPRWEYRYLGNLFNRDEHMEYEGVLLEGGEGGRRPGLPADVEQWNRYRVVILGDVGPADLTPDRQAALAAFVEERGGTLVLIAGDEFMPAAYAGTPIERLLPVELSQSPPAGAEGYGLYVTAEGQAMAAIRLSDDLLADQRLWSEQVTLYRISDYARPKPGAHTLIGCVPRSQAGPAGRDAPAFLCWQYCGRGRVVYLSAPASYRLRQWFGDLYHHRFWGQLLRWSLAREMATGSRTCRLAADRASYNQQEEVQACLRLSDLAGRAVPGAKVTLTARQDDRPVARVDMAEDPQEPGLYKAALGHLPAGEVTLAVAGRAVDDLLAAEGIQGPIETRVRIEPDLSIELRNTRCNLPLLQQIADATGGQVLPPTALEAAVASLDLEPSVSRTVTEQPQWVRWRYLWLFVGLLAAEWALRKLAGLA